MDTNNQDEWRPLIDQIRSNGAILTYNYLQYAVDQSKVLEDVLSYAKRQGARRIILAGASRGGVASVKVAARLAVDRAIVGVVSFSAPIEYDGVRFFTREELARIPVPKLIICSEQDDCAEGTMEMFRLLSDPKKLCAYAGSAHGTDMFDAHRIVIADTIKQFITLLIPIDEA